MVNANNKCNIFLYSFYKIRIELIQVVSINGKHETHFVLSLYLQQK